MCGPTGSMFCMGMSIFATLFLGMLAILIHNDYPYVGEWFESKPATAGSAVEPLEEQREAAVKNLWVTAGVYAALGVVSGLVVCVHRIRGRL
eukprot:scaffold1.g5216.t1